MGEFEEFYIFQQNTHCVCDKIDKKDFFRPIKATFMKIMVAI